MSSRNVCFGFVDLQGKMFMAVGRTKVVVPACPMPSTPTQVTASAPEPIPREGESSEVSYGEKNLKSAPWGRIMELER